MGQVEPSPFIGHRTAKALPRRTISEIKIGKRNELWENKWAIETLGLEKRVLYISLTIF